MTNFEVDEFIIIENKKKKRKLLKDCNNNTCQSKTVAFEFNPDAKEFIPRFRFNPCAKEFFPTKLKPVSCLTKPSSMKKNKVVRFNEELLVEVIEFIDTEDDKAVRRNYWQIYAMDRSRFMDRFNQIKGIFDYVFLPEVRERVYLKYFSSAPHPSSSSFDIDDIVFLDF